MFAIIGYRTFFFSNVYSKNINIDMYRHMLHVVFYGCGTWSFTLKEKHNPKVLQKRVLRMIFGRKRDEVTEKCKKLHERSFTISTPRQILTQE